MSEQSKTITANCPLCKCLIPIVFVKVITTGWWRKTVKFEVDGDATDFVMHMFAHQQGMEDPL